MVNVFLFWHFSVRYNVSFFLNNSQKHAPLIKCIFLTFFMKFYLLAFNKNEKKKKKKKKEGHDGPGLLT